MFCREFGWTPSEFDEQDPLTIKRFLQIQQIETRVREIHNAIPNS